MKDFATLIQKLDQTTKTIPKINHLRDYFSTASDEDKLWAVYLLTCNKISKVVNSTEYKNFAIEYSKLPTWLFEESYAIVGDLSETIAMVVGDPHKTLRSEKTLTDWIEYMSALRNKSIDEKKKAIFTAWDSLTRDEIFVFNKLLSASFRIGVAKNLVIKALSKVSGIEEAVVTHRLAGKLTPGEHTFNELIYSTDNKIIKPYPFYLAYQLDKNPQELGDEKDWNAEWKWDGIRSQLVVKDGKVFLWSRGEDLITESFPEFEALASSNKNFVIDGELLAYKNKPLSFNVLQKRLGRVKVSVKNMEDSPVIIMAYDLLELDGEDLRQKPFKFRREKLVEVVGNMKQETRNSLKTGHGASSKGELVVLSPAIRFKSWDDLIEIRKESRKNMAEGIFLKKMDSVYGVGRRRGDWWKWKIEPLTLDCVLIYAQRGHGRRANLYTDYTFAVWEGEKLVPIVKAYSGLTDEEINKVDKFVKNNTKDKFGPVRSVTPQLVFEIAFEGIQASPRHKSGIALRFPRILRIREDKPVNEADTLQNAQDLLKQYG